MGLARGKAWRYRDFSYKVVSRAGVGTSIAIPELATAIDVAQGLPFVLDMHTFLITHAHSDHAHGIPYVISQKNLNHHRTPVFYMPEYMLTPLKDIMDSWQSMVNFKYDYEFRPARVGEVYHLKGPYYFTPFRAVHTIECQGYTVIRRANKLKEEYQELSRQKLIQMRDRGEEITYPVDTPEVSYTGDSQIEFLDTNNFAKKSKLLFMEITYLDEKRSASSAREWGHIHLDHVLERLNDFENEKVAVVHLSRRYTYKEAHRIIKERIPKEFLDKFYLYPL